MIKLVAGHGRQGQDPGGDLSRSRVLCSTKAWAAAATCFFAIKDDVINARAQYLDEEVVRDGQSLPAASPTTYRLSCRR